MNVSNWRKVGRVSWRWRFEFKLPDFWIGVFWRQTASDFLDVWICFVPCLPLHLQFFKRGGEMNIALGSAFRNAAGAQINRWASQCCSLEMALENLGHSFRMIAVEGDSTDNTTNELHDLGLCGAPISVVHSNHGKRIFGSTEEEDRLAALSQVGNAILSAVDEEDDILIYVESDLIWKAYTMICLIDEVMNGRDVVAPMIFAGDNFYDIFVYRGLDGERFSPFPPYHKHLTLSETLPVEVESAGSCLVMKAEVARKCRIRDDRALLGFCKDVRESGYRIFVDPTQRIYHP